MRNTVLALLVALLTAPAYSASVEQLVPAGTIFQCTVSEPKLSSKTVDVGDPILCDIGYSGYSEQLGHARLPYDSFVVGHFEDYKDPGHFVGKGWMELKFERLIIEPNTVIPIRAKVVGVPGYNVDRQGRILGKGHPVRDTVGWMIPILWPIDAINLPRRGPRPTLKAETQLSLKVMDDFGVPATEEPQEVSPGLYRREPTSYAPQPAVTYPSSPPAVPAYTPMTASPPPAYWWYAAPPPPAVASWESASSKAEYRPPYTGPDETQPMANSGYARAPYTGTDAVRPLTNAEYSRPVYASTDEMQPLTLIFNDGRPPEQAYNYMLTTSALYVLDGEHQTIPLRELDLTTMSDVNRKAGVDFRAPIVYRQ